MLIGYERGERQRQQGAWLEGLEVRVGAETWLCCGGLAVSVCCTLLCMHTREEYGESMAVGRSGL